MCLIIHKPANIILTKEQLHPVYRANKDGFGLMYLDGTTIRYEKIIPENIDEILSTLEPHKERELGIHFRLKTHGERSVDNVHPYKILDTADGDPFDAYLMHNGVLSSFTADTTIHSDTFNFIKDYIKPLLISDGPSILETATFKEAIQQKIGTNNRLLILTPDGFKIFNEQIGNRTKIEGVWCSNTYAFEEETPVRSPYTPNYNYYGATHSRPNETSYPWGVLPALFSGQREQIFGTTPIIAKPVVAKPIIDLPPPIKRTPKEPDTDLNSTFTIPGVGPHSVYDLQDMKDADLFRLMVENPEDFFDFFSDYKTEMLDTVIDMIEDEFDEHHTNEAEEKVRTIAREN